MVCQNWRNLIYQPFVFTITHVVLYLIYLIQFLTILYKNSGPFKIWYLTLIWTKINWGPLTDSVFVFCQPGFLKLVKIKHQLVGLLQNLHSDTFINTANSGPLICESSIFITGTLWQRKVLAGVCSSDGHKDWVLLSMLHRSLGGTCGRQV